jgi:subtilisin family serine protease
VLAACLAAAHAAPAETSIRLTPAQRAEALASGRVARIVVERLDREERVPVLVVFRAAGAGDPAAPPRRFDAGLEADVRARGDALLRRLAVEDFEPSRRYRALHGMAGRVTPRGLAALLADPEVLHVDEDAGGTGHLLQAVPLANLDEVHAQGYRGDGITVAVIDSGVNTGHVDIGAAVVAEQCFCSGGGGCCPAGGSTQSGPGAAVDDNGHGTNVTGIVTSDGNVAPEGGAPDAAIVAIKVLDASNSFCCSSDVIAGLDWILANRPDVDVVNMSLGTFATFAGECDAVAGSPMLYAAAIDALRANGVLSMVSSGNTGSTTAMSAPACVGGAIAVGAVWDASLGSQTFFGCTDNPTTADRLTCWSNRNATTDLLAPGAITTSTGVGGGTSSYLGTSQASPLVAACAALLRESDPSLTAGQLEAALESSPTQVTDPVTSLVYPRLDCAHALLVAGAQAVPLPAWLLPALLALLAAPGAAGARSRRRARQSPVPSVAARSSANDDSRHSA